MTTDVKSQPRKKDQLTAIGYVTFSAILYSNTDLFSWTPSWHWVWHRLEVLPLLTSSSVCNLLNSMEMVSMEKSSGPLRIFQHSGTVLQSSGLYVQYTNRRNCSSWWDCVYLCWSLIFSRQIQWHLHYHIIHNLRPNHLAETLWKETETGLSQTVTALELQTLHCKYCKWMFIA